MKEIKIPGPMRMIWGSLAAYWLAHTLNAGFNAVAIMLLMMIPVVIVDLYFKLPVQEESIQPLPPIPPNPDNSVQEDSA